MVLQIVSLLFSLLFAGVQGECNDLEKYYKYYNYGSTIIRYLCEQSAIMLNLLINGLNVLIGTATLTHTHTLILKTMCAHNSTTQNNVFLSWKILGLNMYSGESVENTTRERECGGGSLRYMGS